MSNHHDSADLAAVAAQALEPREQRGLAIAESRTLRQKGNLWIVPSQAGHGSYVVEPSQSPSCSCPDFETRQIKCKHIWAVEYTVLRERTADGESVTETLRVTYSQNWPAYNAAQTAEKERVAELLRDLCGAIDNPAHSNGRPRLPLSDAVFCAVMKVYLGCSGRRAMTDLREFEAKGLIAKAPCYNSIFNVFEDPALTSLLKAMIEESARPLRSVEAEFAVDSSGFSTRCYRRWYDHKYGRERAREEYVKAHVMIGVSTNIVTSVEVTPGYVNDYPLLPPLLKSTIARFDVARLSADKGYSGRSNVAAIDAIGATPLIPFKARANSKGSGVWKQAFAFFQDHRDEFLRLYHKRSNIETTFSMIKAKFGGFVRSKTAAAQVNEVLCKVLAHNLCVLVQSFYELGIAAEFWANETAPAAPAVGSPFWTQNLPARVPWSGPRKKGCKPVRHDGPGR